MSSITERQVWRANMIRPGWVELFDMGLGMKAIILAAAAIAQLALAGTASAAQCANSSIIESRLETKFGERLTYVGQARENHEVLVYTSRKTGRWTMLVATPTGLSCLVATGRGEASLGQRLGDQVDVAFR